ncbi:hypothetical protein [Changchengzhania lutea]|uniref:hypothetical protein n=1 Tax=Changchengzhania lutea TaxID=2049305 RepID=UPI00115EDB20|nr:hypothetical protein [Changchengzhania lutea]
MLEFLTAHFHFIVYSFEIVSAIIGLLYYKKYKNTTTLIFIYFLLYTVFVELLGASLVYFQHTAIIQFLRSFGMRSMIWFNVFWMFGSVLFLAYYYHAILKTKRYKQYVILLSAVFGMVFIGYVIFDFQTFLVAHSPIYQLLGAATITICITIYFIELLNSQDILIAFRSVSFYVSISIFFWWIIVTPAFLFDAYNTVSDWDFVNLRRRIFLFANIFMYTCFIIGLIVSKPALKND